MAQLDVRDAAALKRLLAKLVDALPSAILVGILTAVGVSTIETQPVSAVSQQVTLTGFLISQGVATLVSLAYAVFIWGWEAKTGKTPGNLLMGLRTTDEHGNAAGWLPIFVRGLIIAVSGLVPVIGTVLVLISNLFDADGKKQGWHDKAAHTRVFDVRAGRNPLVTGGLGGPASFAPPEPPPGLQPVASPVPGASARLPQGAASAPPAERAPLPPREAGSDAVDDATSRPTRDQLGSASAQYATGQQGDRAASGARTPATSRTGTAADAGLPGPVEPMQRPVERREAAAAPAVSSFAPSSSVPDSSAPARGAAPGAHPDDDVDETRVTSVRSTARCRILFDNGREVVLRSQALIGRNPAGQNGEMIDQLIDFSDQGRSVSKTHLHLRVEGQGLWVTDRNSTNGSAITSPDGQRTRVRGGETLLAQPGSTVHFGDRSFLVVRP